MANVTDVYATAVHGTDPQNLMEYIVRQKIYDSRYWKEECFGLTAADVLEKASTLTCVGASFGGNSQPTKFLSLVLKLLQNPPDDAVVQEFLNADDFKYVRALGAFYQRLTGRPADIYERLEPLYNDYTKLRYRDVTEWKILHMDEFIHSLLTSDRVCGIALPRLASRKTLQEEGYLEDAPRMTALREVLEDYSMDTSRKFSSPAEQYLYEKVQQGSLAAKVAWDERQARKQERAKEKGLILDDSQSPSEETTKTPTSHYGSLFKKDNKNDGPSKKKRKTDQNASPTDAAPPEEGSDEYWNQQRAALGLAPLKK